MTDAPEPIAGRVSPGRFRKWRARLNRLRRVNLWGAAGLVHALFDAPRPRVARSRFALPVDRALVARIAANYRRSDGNRFAMWADIRPLQQALDSGDLDSLADQLGGLFQGTLVAGMGHPESAYFGGRVWRKDFAELRMTDLLLCLGEALGVLPLPNHAQMKLTEYVDFVYTDQHALFRRIEQVLGFSLAMLPVGHAPVFTLDGVDTSADMIRHAYLADRIRQLGIDADEPVVEIGAGFGSLALLAYRAGFRDYTIVDLPAVNAIQTFFLGSVLGADAVSGFGEQRRGIRIMPPVAIRDIADGSVALVVNVDSLPEIERGEALEYLREIRRISRFFLSVNQEAQALHPRGAPQTLVPALVAEVGGFERMYRFPYWMMEGYAEELYRVVR